MNSFKYAGLNHSSVDLEMQWILLDITHMRNIVIINIYRPPQGDYKTACRLISDSIRKADLKDNVELFLMGDFNINISDKRSPMVRELESTTSFWGLRSLIHENTRLGVRDNVLKGTCIDNIFTNSDEVTEVKVLDWNFSDHLVIAARRKRERAKQPKVSFKGRSYRNYVREEIQEEIVEADWEEYYRTRDPSVCWDYIEKLVRAYLDKTCKIRDFKVKQIVDPWITNELLEEIRDKDSYLRRAKETRSVEDWARARAERNRVGRLIEQAKAEFLKEQQEELAGDPKKFWRLIKSIVPGKMGKASQITLVDRSNVGGTAREVNVEKRDTADFINNFFSSIGGKLAANFDQQWEFKGVTTAEECQPLYADFELVSKLCKEIKTTKASGFSDISSRVLKDVFRVIVPQLVYLYNLSFEVGSFPDKWKIATIIPLPKGGDRTEVSNFRPVSLLPLPGKIIEKVAHAKFSSFLDRHGIISDKQGGFRKGFSTAKSMAELTDNILSIINEGKTSLAVFVDLRKAFDTVNHEVLIKKLEHYGIRGQNLIWCKDYLCNRLQKTLANGELSSAVRVTCGVPQGSVLGPLFFIAYVNDLQNVIQGAEAQLYADDTVIHASAYSAEEAARQLQPAINKFSEWCCMNKLSLNTAKTKQMAFGTRQRVKKARNVTLEINNVPLQTVPTYKYLGITLDSTLTYNYHVKTVANMVTYKSVLLGKIRRNLNENVAMSIYKTMILPYFDYGDIIYDNASVEILDKLQRLQNKCLKICKGYNNRYSTKDLHHETNTPMLEDRRKVHINNFMFSRKGDRERMDRKEVRTRAHDGPLFKVKTPRVETYKRAVEYAGSVQWNKLPAEVRNIIDVNEFKRHQKNFLKKSIPT